MTMFNKGRSGRGGGTRLDRTRARGPIRTAAAGAAAPVTPAPVVPVDPLGAGDVPAAGTAPTASQFLAHPDDFARLVERYQKLLFKYVYNIFRDYHLAQDLSQEIFLKVYASLANYNVKYPFSTWLLRVAHNYSIDHLRKKKLQLVSLETKMGDTRVADSLWASLPAASREYERTVERDTIKEAIFALHSDYRSVIFLRYIEGVKLEDIAYILGIPLGTVKSRINRARLLLQRKLKDLELR